MCLIIQNFSDLRVKTAEQPIVVFKRFKRHPSQLEPAKLPEGTPKILISPYRNTEYMMSDDEYNTFVDTNKLRRDWFLGFQVKTGIHTFATLSDAMKDCEYTNIDVVHRCQIPAGAKYYIGTFGHTNTVTYASDKIEINEQVFEFTDWLQLSHYCGGFW